MVVSGLYRNSLRLGRVILHNHWIHSSLAFSNQYIMNNQKTKQKIIIDTDAGLDDAQAILMALASSQVEIVAMTTVSGNTNPHQVALNVLRILKLTSRLDIPVFVGSEKAFNGKDVEDCAYYHGYDGFGECPDPQAPNADTIQKEDGVNALLRLSTEHSGELTIVCLGPLTNIANAIKLDKSLGKRLKSCYIMGGNYYAKGNVDGTTAEFNFYTDPEAAKEVLHGLECPKTLLGWEVCLDNAFSWEWYFSLWKIDSPKIRFLEKLEQYPYNKHYLQLIEKGSDSSYIMADQFIMGVMLNSEVVSEVKSLYADIELKGDLTRGQMVVDWGKRTGKKPNVNIVTKINQKAVVEILEKAMASDI